MDGNLDQHSFDVIANASGIDANIACNLVQSGKEAHKLADQEKPTGEPSGRISKSPKVQKQGKAVRSKPKKSVEASLNNQLLQENSIQLEEVKGMLRRIMNKLFPEEAAIRQPSGLPKLPISNYEHLKQLEDYLSNAENFGIMVNYLFCKVKHTHTEQACAKAALNALFKPSLCCAISWKGTHGTKYAIYGTQCVELIQCVATKLWDSATDLCALNGAIKRFFIVSLQKKTSSSLAEHDESSEDSANSASSGTEVESEPDEDSD
ncbi:uncharacterized protein LOC127751684 isoform X4 [Frankliniella occidentalis]|uniref:Uncharacterized protein LOC127751684 isoform X1 n=1 Tax=Frankliniella occidentalis TaxID=133901 RepID=A0A9C6X9N8_FRAOC|nr:uncharacterized protein LOC127751684 isoform X1 [Frankliniella occidentalis]XP_052131600.1 uncharacterized protein LOC127751684 isoform X2 [Frankliniella occidentalis]XP_052131601.1 uncharacterized protein LOC127751684 isoform X3 [Frankliniella occidentalis]XP_052131602.1 uncharacterized protein LOC127751684 isoform X4 [Frankliniella occidentalis]